MILFEFLLATLSTKSLAPDIHSLPSKLLREHYIYNSTNRTTLLTAAILTPYPHTTLPQHSALTHNTAQPPSLPAPPDISAPHKWRPRPTPSHYIRSVVCAIVSMIRQVVSHSWLFYQGSKFVQRNRSTYDIPEVRRTTILPLVDGAAGTAFFGDDDALVRGRGGGRRGGRESEWERSERQEEG